MPRYAEDARLAAPTRREREHRRRSVELVVTITWSSLGVAYASTQIDGSANAGGAGDSPSSAGAAGRRALLALSVTGAPKPLLAVVGTAGSPPAAMGVPQGLTLEVPGAGDLTTRRVAALPGPSVQVALSNVVGAWTAHYAVTDIAHLGDLGRPQRRVAGRTARGRHAGRCRSSDPAAVRMTGVQVAAFLGAENQNTFTRWEVVLAGCSRRRRSWSRGDLTETDDVAGVQATLDGAKGGRIETLPVQVAAATVRVPKYPALDAAHGGTVRREADPGAR